MKFRLVKKSDEHSIFPAVETRTDGRGSGIDFLFLWSRKKGGRDEEDRFSPPVSARASAVSCRSHTHRRRHSHRIRWYWNGEQRRRGSTRATSACVGHSRIRERISVSRRSISSWPRSLSRARMAASISTSLCRPKCRWSRFQPVAQELWLSIWGILKIPGRIGSQLRIIHSPTLQENAGKQREGNWWWKEKHYLP